MQIMRFTQHRLLFTVCGMELDAAERIALGIPPRPLDRQAVVALVDALVSESDAARAGDLIDRLDRRVPPGVDQAAEVKAAFLGQITRHEVRCEHLPPSQAVGMLGTMIGGYNVAPLVAAVDDPAETV